MTDNGNDKLVYMLELFFKTPVTQEEVDNILSLQNADGSWRDIDYNDTKISRCEQTAHAVRFQRLAVYHKLHPEREDVTSALHAALAYWGATMPVTRNWYYNQVNIPKAFAPGFLLFKDEMTPEELRIASAQMRRAKLTRTGQNLVWEAGNLLIAGLLESDEDFVRKMAQIIQSELKISESVAGLQPDWSFLQHGAQLQFGNYGQSFLVSQAWWAKVLEGTSLALSEEKMTILRGYLTKGVGRTIWGGYMDFNALGRQVAPNSSLSKAISLSYAMENIGLSEKDIEAGPRYYPSADFGNYRGEGWYASIRMQSSRTIGYEEINGENQKGYFSADGALLVYRTGNEFSEVTPVWNWRHIPGTTTYDDGTELWGSHVNLPYNKSSRVFGHVDGDVMVVAMEYDRDSVFARKIWAFTSDMILCLGHGISSRRDNDQIVTTVEQVPVSGTIVYGKDYISHNGVTYLSLKAPFTFAGTTQGTGSWRTAAPTYSDELVNREMLEIYFSHGAQPKNAEYAYCIIPSGTVDKKAIRKAKSQIEILTESSARLGKSFFEVKWNENKIDIIR